MCPLTVPPSDQPGRPRGGGQLNAGEPRWVGAQEHAGENIGDTDTRALFIELKEPAPHAVAGSLGPSSA